MPELTHDDAIVNGVRHHYVEAGEGPLVVLLHGFPEFWYSWRKQIPALAEAGYRVVAPDLRGYNASEKPHSVEQYGLDELVGDVLGLIDHFDEESAHIVGHDWGGLIAWEVAIRHPERVEKLAVLNAPHPERFREMLRTPEQLRRSWYVFYFQLPWLPERLLSIRNYTPIAELFRDGAENPNAFDELDIQRYVEAAKQPGALTSAINYYRALFWERARNELRALFGRSRSNNEVQAPTLLIWGEQDAALRVELTEGMERWVPNLRVERLPNASHWVQNDRPEKVSNLLVEFLEG
ncbi:Pimeloyl-ACP methyl ester carboxylesterase [Haladaptatus litoreus]|uniref:Pimeloyl-ACP methyl ester carboxylesterase n=1 Tax=Haladaptatus litoreus TaxID=553468 RepID=A0A1N6Y4H7_9EURY|nr:alpha/beta hydrolase [Haladaptatus litoreus]SIR09454.1 Pimeloyl-ACP methyl ester carboxylesterase [Haladaptatus litoreus]